MDLLGSLRKLLGVPFAEQPKPQQPNPTGMPRRDDILSYAQEGPVPKTVRPYKQSPMEIGTMDKPYKRLRAFNVPSSLNALLPQNEQSKRYSMYFNPNGGATLENDEAELDDPSRVIPFRQQPQIPDRPYNTTIPRNIPTAEPQWQRRIPKTYPSSRI